MTSLRKAARLLKDALREIFDENAYARYLARNDAIASRESYAAFLREVEHARAQRPRCC
ncbi:MAG: hypothetical protein L0Z53_12470 [Acidobacteriales bacterium]|nr:hypothetical protein [Terriglobales bacterium]